MTNTDYNRRVAVALGWKFEDGLWSSPGCYRDSGQPPDYATDWRELPAILEALDSFGGWRVQRVPGGGDPRYFIQSNAVRAGVCVHATEDNLLLAAGALLLKLAEGKS